MKLKTFDFDYERCLHSLTSTEIRQVGQECNFGTQRALEVLTRNADD